MKSLKMNNSHLIRTVGIFSIVILLMTIVAAFEFDNVKDYNLATKTITITNAFGLGAKLAEITLTANTDYCLKDCYAEGTITLYTSGKLWDNVAFKKLSTTWKDSTLNYNVKIKTGETSKEVEDYSYVCDKTGLTFENGTAEIKCDNKLIGTHIEATPIWSAYDNKDLPIGTYTWRIEGQKQPNEIVEWIGEWQGMKLTEWATWNSTFENGLLAYWNFDEGAGALAKDVKASTHNATLVNTPAWVTGKSGSALNFDGSSGEFGNVSILLGDSTFNLSTITVMAWVNSTGDAFTTDYPKVIMKDRTAGDSSWALGINQAGNPGQWVAEVGATTVAGSDYATSQSKWQLILFTQNKSGTHLFVNGSYVSRGNSAMVNSTANIEIGKGRTTRWWNGTIDEVAIWGRALGETEIAGLWDNGVGTFYSLPTITTALVSPANGYSYLNSTPIDFNWTISPTSINVTNWTLYIWHNDGTLDYSLFKTEDSTILISRNKTKYLDNGNYIWNVYGCGVTTDGSTVKCDFDVNRTFTLTNSYFSYARCNSTMALKVLNISFLDETTLVVLNATLDASEWSYLGNSYSYANTSYNYYYDFCVFPNASGSFNMNGTLRYSNAESATYPQRRLTIVNDVYSNQTLTQKVLYLLNYNNGITSTYQVVNTGGQVIEGAYIKVERTISSNTTFIAGGYTDSAGTISFFLNPNYAHTLTISKSGYTTQVETITPSSSTYTITMGTTTSPFSYTNPVEGITYSKWPPSGILTRGGFYNFTFQVFSRNDNIYNCSFNIKFYNGTVKAHMDGCNASAPNMDNGGTISKMINWTGIDRLKGEYYITISNGTIWMIEADARWILVNMSGSNSFSFGLKDALNNSYNMPEWGGKCPEGYTLNNTDLYCYNAAGDRIWNQTADFSRIVFFFLGLAIVLAMLNFFTSYDTAYPGAFLYIVTALIILINLASGLGGPGYFYLPGATSDTFLGGFSSFADNWILAVHMSIICVIYFLTTNKRYQTG